MMPSRIVSMKIGYGILFVIFLFSSSCTNMVKFEYENPFAQNEGDMLKLTGYLSKPEGDGPFPAVILLHGCGGITKRSRIWADRLNKWGYATLILDSFGPRWVFNACNGGVSRDERAYDAYAAKSYLSSVPFIDLNRIALMGFSHGGNTVLCAINEKCLFDISETPFAAAIAFYPNCAGNIKFITSPLLVLIGENDDWTPAGPCHYLDELPRGTYDVKFIFYPNSYHCFDVPRKTKYYMGHRLEYNKNAAENAKIQVKEFLGKYLN
jgi:dienelactone hydrolase